MRRLLLVPALALVLLGAPVLALEDPEPPPTTTTSIPLTPGAPEPTATTAATAPPTSDPASTTEPVAPEGTVQAGWESETTPIYATLVGVTWDGDPEAEFLVEVRASDGSWDRAELHAADTGADAGSPDASRAEQFPANATEPLWVGDDANAVRVTLEKGEASDIEVAAVDAESASAPGGAAGAFVGVVGTVDGARRWLFGAALLVVVAGLVALALGWRPRAREGRRSSVRVVALVAAGAALLAACVPVAPPAPPPGTVGNGDYPVQPQIYTRLHWGARPFACAGGPEYASSLRFAVVHHTVNSNGYGPGDSPGIVRGIQGYHLDALGYCDIAYHFLVDRFGTIWEGRAGGVTSPVIGGHSGGFNTGSVGVALIGDFTSVQPPAATWSSLVSLLQWRLSHGHVNPAAGITMTAGTSPCGCVRYHPGQLLYFPNAILNHRDLNTTACPGNAFAPRLTELQNAVQPGVRYPH